MKKILSIFLFFSLQAAATDRYVSTTGTNSGAGGIGAPWRTLVYACANSSSGDIIHVAAGTYTETAQIVLGTGISIEGADSATTIIKSTLTADFTEMLNCRSAMGTNGNQHITGLKFDGQNSTWALIRIGGRSNFEIYNCDFVDAKIHGVTFAARNTDDNDPGFPTTYCTGNKFYNNTMTNCGGWEIPNTGGNGFGNLQFGGQNGFLVYDNTIIQNRAPYNNGWPIKYWQGGYNIGCKIYNNYLQHRLQDFALGDQNWDFAIEMFNVAGLEVYNNTIVNGAIDVNGTTTTGYNTGVGSFWSAGYGYVLHAHDNTFYCQTANSHVQTAITLEFNIDSVIIERNTFDKFNIGVLFTPRTGNTVSNVTIRNNLFTNVTIGDGNEGYFIDCGVYSGVNINFNKLNIYNNTFLASAGAPIVNGFMLPNSTSGGTLKNFNIKNNILKNTSGAPIRVREGTVACDSLDIQYNSIYNCGNSNTPTYSVSPTHYTFSNNVNINPLFGSGYKLVTSNALVDAGVDVGLPYLGSAPDINWTDSTEVYSPSPAECNSFDTTIVGPNVSLSNSNKTITKTGFSDMTAFTSQGKSSGKYYWTVHVDAADTSDLYNFFMGIANPGHSTSVPPYGDSSYVMRSDGQFFHSGFYTYYGTGGSWTGTGFGTGADICFALDLTGSGRLDVYRKLGGIWVQKENYFNGIVTSSAWYPVVGVAGRPCIYTINLSPTDIPAGLEAAGYSAYCTASSVPVVNSTTPLSGETGIPIGNNIVLRFSEDMDAATITNSSVYIAGVSSTLSEDNGVVTINSVGNLSYSTVYSVYIDSTVKSASGVPMASPYSYTFTTLAAPGSNTVIKTGRKIIRKQ